MTQIVRLPMVVPLAALPPEATPVSSLPAEPGAGAPEAVASSPALDDARGASKGGCDGDAGEERMQVGDLARITGKTVRALHLYEELGLLNPVARSKGRYRLYSRDSLTRIRWIGKLQDMGFSLTDIQAVVRDWENGGSAPGAMRKMREVYTKKLEETREHLRRLQTLEKEIVESLGYLDTCDVCDPERLLGTCKKCDLHGCDDAVPDLVAGFRASSHSS